MNDWKYFNVTAEISWFDGGTLCDAKVTMKIHAKSTGHAISRVKDQLEKIGSHKVDDIAAKETRE